MKYIKSVMTVVIIIMVLSSVSFAETAERYYDIGVKLYKTRNYSKALSYFTKAAKADKTNPEYFHMIGNCYEKNGAAGKSKTVFKFCG